MRAVTFALLLLVIATTFSGLNCAGDPPADPPPTDVAPVVGKYAPDFSLTNLGGDVVTLKSLRGKPVLLNIWAKWCPPCIAELPWFQDVSNRYSDRVNVVTVNIGEDRATVEQFMSDNRYTFNVLLDYPAKSMAVAYRAAFIPDTFSIDKNGIVKAVRVGSFETLQELENLIR
jgi:thiol-disulfide isomerase/thioredoxin